MIRRFNYTGRRRIRHEDALITVRPGADGMPVFSAHLSLERYRLPADALVFVEAKRVASFMRFPWGRVRQLVPSPQRTLSEFATADGLKFRVKVVEAMETNSGRPARLLALADQIRPEFLESPQRPLSLLDIVPADLQEEVWKVEFADDEPKLQINRRLVSSPSQLARDEHFVSLVLPQVLRVILSRILIFDRFDSGSDTADDLADWRAKWLQFSKTLPGIEDPPSIECDAGGRLENEDDLERWIDDAVRAFARKFHIDRQFTNWWNEGEAACD